MRRLPWKQSRASFGRRISANFRKQAFYRLSIGFKVFQPKPVVKPRITRPGLYRVDSLRVEWLHNITSDWCTDLPDQVEMAWKLISPAISLPEISLDSINHWEEYTLEFLSTPSTLCPGRQNTYGFRWAKLLRHHMDTFQYEYQPINKPRAKKSLTIWGFGDYIGIGAGACRSL